jgi:hypothetical protein
MRIGRSPVHIRAVDEDHDRGDSPRERRRTTRLGYLHDRPVLDNVIRPVDGFVVHCDSTGAVLAGGASRRDRHRWALS